MLFDFNAPTDTTYGNGFDTTQYERDSRWFNKQKNIQDGARPWWQAALQFIPFGIGNAISPAIEAGISKGRNEYQGRLDKMAGTADDPSFDYGFSSNGPFYATQRTVPMIDNPGAKDAAIAAAVGGVVKAGASQAANELGANSGYGAFEADFSAINPPATNNINVGQDTTLVNAPGVNGQQVVTNPTTGNMDWNSAWNDPDGQFVTGYRDGGVMVTGGEKGEDDIALINMRTGKDTGKRVSAGEKIVFSEEVLDALGMALKSKDKDAVFKLVKEQIKKKPNKDGGLAEGGVIDVVRSPGNADWAAWGGGAYAPDDTYYVAPPSNTYGGFGSAGIPATGMADSQPSVGLGFDGSYWAPQIAGDAFDSFRFAQGMMGADTTIPVWNKPADWMSYLNRAKQASQSGFSGVERASLQDQIDRQYITDLSNIYKTAGGNSGLVLGNMGRANTSRYNAVVDAAVKDAALQRSNMGQYGSVVAQDVNLDRMIFNDALQLAQGTEAAGARLAQDAMANMKDRAVFNQYYNPNSAHGRMVESQAKSAETSVARQKAFMEFLKNNPDAWMRFGVGSSAGAGDAPGVQGDMGRQYDDYRRGGGTLGYSDFIKTVK